MFACVCKSMPTMSSCPSTLQLTLLVCLGLLCLLLFTDSTGSKGPAQPLNTTQANCSAAHINGGICSPGDNGDVSENATAGPLKAKQEDQFPTNSSLPTSHTSVSRALNDSVAPPPPSTTTGLATQAAHSGTTTSSTGAATAAAIQPAGTSAATTATSTTLMTTKTTAITTPRSAAATATSTTLTTKTTAITTPRSAAATATSTTLTTKTTAISTPSAAPTATSTTLTTKTTAISTPSAAPTATSTTLTLEATAIIPPSAATAAASTTPPVAETSKAAHPETSVKAKTGLTTANPTVAMTTTNGTKISPPPPSAATPHHTRSTGKPPVQTSLSKGPTTSPSRPTGRSAPVAPGPRVPAVDVAGAPLTKQLVDTASLLSVLLFGLLFFLVTVAVFVTQAYESYRRKDYTQVDYLINGMYSDSGV
ncbi:uncharacterized protein C11orf24 [Etheostoma cragini]|uniref:uncharacterized protein C11orf24 n=1 Tax=Etheostoma cragini TaxID=417921 RepID=UPI00155DFBE7|nr:uncharacterized protein C11orf24 [Etheostoma cragini]